jgi:hypothetical protein
MPDLVFYGVRDFDGDTVPDQVRVSGDATAGFTTRLELLNADGSVRESVIPAEAYISKDDAGVPQIISIYTQSHPEEASGSDHLPDGVKVIVPFNGPGDGPGGCNANKIVLWRGSLDGWKHEDIKDKWSLLACDGDVQKVTPEIRQVQGEDAKTISFRNKS